MSKNYDIVVLGGGIGGYVAAIRAAQLGKTVAIVEKDKLGGTCLHRGCIPSKSLLRSAEVYSTMKDSESYGITASSVELDFTKVQLRKEKIVAQLHKGIEYLMKKHKIEVFKGNGRVIGPSIFSPKSGALAVEGEDGESETLVSTNLIIATGSKPRQLKGMAANSRRIMNSDDALLMEELPQSIIIIGGGVIGVEWASMLSDFGVEVTLVEYAERIVPLEDEAISKELARLFKKRKMRIVTGAKVLPESIVEDGDSVTVKAMVNDEQLQFSADRVLVCIGRDANVENIGLGNTDVKVENGVIKVNSYMQTTEKHIYAIGDVNGGLQLAHVASHEGILAVEHITGNPVEPTSQHLIPKCIYTHPEVASVGWTESQAQEQGFDVKVGLFNFKAIGKALVYGETDGFVKVVADSKTNDILGVHMIGPHVTEYISEASLAKLLDATPWEVGQSIHPHPTLSEALGEAMLAVDGMAIGM
ncbi:MAG TPA: dihydrolipoyl dehydrogenase [Bacilli bacterium]